MEKIDKEIISGLHKIGKIIEKNRKREKRELDKKIKKVSKAVYK